MSKHEHTTTTPGAIYDYCECGAVRRAATADHPAEPWHVCEACALPGTVLK